MLVSYKWLNEYVDIKDIEVEDLADLMSRTGLEVEGIEQFGKDLKKVVVGHTLKVEDHPDASHLHVCQVDVGEEDPLQIVCGAPNIAENQKVIVALPNSRVAGNIKIKKGKLRGVVSQGMICSLQEIGIPENVVPKAYADGIMVLPEDVPVGEDIKTYLGLEDPILDIDITPNRADALSLRGVAHEVGAIYDRKVTFPTSPEEVEGNLKDEVELKVEDTTLFPEYNAFLVKNVKVQPSPLKIQMRLMKEGIRPINNVVDATNYVLLEYGQPLHAFDYDKLKSKVIAPRLARKGETLVTLDGIERQLTSHDLVITAGDEPVALAGIMGGLETEVDEHTTTVMIEAAQFEGGHIRKTARRLSLHSESSLRNERGVNKATIAEAGAYAARLMEEWAGGHRVPGKVRHSVVDTAPVQVQSDLAYINRMLGMTLTYEEMLECFRKLGFPVEGTAENFTVSVPARRWDIHISADLVEEVARIYGYDKLPSHLPAIPPVNLGLNAWQRFVRQSSRCLEALGFNQVIAYSLTSENKVKVLQSHPHEAVVLDFPMSDDRKLLRTNLLTTLLDIAQYNINRNVKNVQIYEVGRVFYEDQIEDGLPKEESHAAGLWTGNISEKGWQEDAIPVDFYAMKGAVEEFLEQMNCLDEMTFQAAHDLPDTHPGRTAIIRIGDKEVGYLAQLHPQTAKAYNLAANTFVFEVNMEAIFALPEKEVVQKPLPKYPSVARDIALVVKEEVTNEEICQMIRQSSKAYLTHIKLFDIYRGKGIEEGYKSMAYQLTYQNPEATLVDDEVNTDFEKIKDGLRDQLSAVIRD